jgi:hypothetical protein
MSTGTELKAKLAPLLDMSAVNLDRYLAVLAKAGLIRRSGLGGGKAAHHLQPGEYAYLLLSLAAPTPRTAADAAKELGGVFPHPPREGDGSLLTALTATIATMAMEIRQGINRERDPRDQSWHLALCVEPLFAEATWPAHGPDAVRKYFHYETSKDIVTAPSDELPLVRRQAVLTAPLLRAVAELCADQNEDGEHPPLEKRKEPRQSDRIPRARSVHP